MVYLKERFTERPWGTQGGSGAVCVNAVLLAGGVNRIPLFDGYTPGYKALAPFGGKASVLYVLEALSAVPCVGRVGIVGPEALLRPALAGTPYAGDTCDLVGEGETLWDGIARGLRRFAGDAEVLVLTADLPLVSPGAITDFLAACARVPRRAAASLFLAMAPRRCYTGPYERFTKPFNRFRDIEVCHGNLWLASPRLSENGRLAARVNRIYRSRKNPVATAMAVGPHVGLAYLLGVHLLHVLTLEQMARIAGRCYGVEGVPVVIEHPEITIDVDEAADYRFVMEQLGRCG